MASLIQRWAFIKRKQVKKRENGPSVKKVDARKNNKDQENRRKGMTNENAN